MLVKILWNFLWLNWFKLTTSTMCYYEYNTNMYLQINPMKPTAIFVSLCECFSLNKSLTFMWTKQKNSTIYRNFCYNISHTNTHTHTQSMYSTAKTKMKNTNLMDHFLFNSFCTGKNESFIDWCLIYLFMTLFSMHLKCIRKNSKNN